MSKPAHEIRTDLLSVTIWKNSGENGHWFSVTPSRSYKQGEAWKESDSYGFDDLLTIAKLIDQAHTWINRQMQAEAAARKQAGEKQE